MKTRLTPRLPEVQVVYDIVSHARHPEEGVDVHKNVFSVQIKLSENQDDHLDIGISDGRLVVRYMGGSMLAEGVASNALALRMVDRFNQDKIKW